MGDLSKKNLRRIEKSKLNTTVGFITALVMGVFSFIERTTFNHFFIEDYLGLYSFNYNIIYTLSYIELGLGTSIAYALYKPLEYNDKGQIKAIISFFKKAYIAIGLFLIISGLALLPFLQYLTKTSVPINSVRIYFVLFLLGNASGYIITYKNILFIANQENYKTTLIANVTWTLIYIIEIIIAYTSQNFLYYSIAILSGHLLKNAAMRILADYQFKYLKNVKKEKIEKQTLDRIKKNTVGMISNKLGQALVSSTDSMLISALIGTAILGKYSNYQMIYSGLLSISILIPNSITASLGSAGVTETKRSMTKLFYTIDLGIFFVCTFLTVFFLNLANPIISTFFGEGKTLELSTLALICINFYLASRREIFLTYKASLGLYWEDKVRPLAEGLVNLVFSLLLAHFIGLNGIILGTIISLVFINFIIEPRIVFHKGFSRSTTRYYVLSFLKLLLITLISIFSFYLCSLVSKLTFSLPIINLGGVVIPLKGIIIIIINFTISLVVTFCSLFVFFKKSENASIIINTLKVAFSKRRKKKTIKEAKKEIIEDYHEIPPDA